MVTAIGLKPSSLTLWGLTEILACKSVLQHLVTGEIMVTATLFLLLIFGQIQKD